MKSVSSYAFKKRFLSGIVSGRFEGFIPMFMYCPSPPEGRLEAILKGHFGTIRRFTIRYYPAMATTVDGTVLPRVAFIRRDKIEPFHKILNKMKDDYQSAFHVADWAYPSVDPSSIAYVEPLPNRLPARIVKRLVKAHDTGDDPRGSRGLLAFVLTFEDGRKAAYYGCPAIVPGIDFLSLPDDLCSDEIEDIDLIYGKPPPSGLPRIEPVDYGTIKYCYY